MAEAEPSDIRQRAESQFTVSTRSGSIHTPPNEPELDSDTEEKTSSNIVAITVAEDPIPVPSFSQHSSRRSSVASEKSEKSVKKEENKSRPISRTSSVSPSAPQDVVIVVEPTPKLEKSQSQPKETTTNPPPLQIITSQPLPQHSQYSTNQKGIVTSKVDSVLRTSVGESLEYFPTIQSFSGSDSIADYSTSSAVFRVYFLDGSYKAIKIADPTNVTVEELWEIASEKLSLSIHSAQTFFLWGSSGDLELLLYTHQKIVDVAADWKVWERRYKSDEKPEKTITKTLSKTFLKNILDDNSSSASKSKKEMFKILFRTTSILPLFEEVKHTDSGSVHLYYIQAVYNVIHSNYPCDVETAVKLGGLQFQITVGDQNPDVHKPGYMDSSTVASYIPEHLLSKLKPEDWEFQLLKEHASHKSKDTNTLKNKYLSIVRQWRHYGCTFYKAKYIPQESFYKVDFEGQVRIGCNQNGLHLIDPKILKIESFSFDQIEEWGSEKQVFYVSILLGGSKGLLFSKPATKKYRFQSTQAELIDDLLCDWIAEIEEKPQKTQPKKSAQSKRRDTKADKKIVSA